MEFDDQTAKFNATYVVDVNIKEPTLIFTHDLHYKHGVDIEVSSNGEVLSDRNVIKSDDIKVGVNREGLITVYVYAERLHRQPIDIKIEKTLP